MRPRLWKVLTLASHGQRPGRPLQSPCSQLTSHQGSPARAPLPTSPQPAPPDQPGKPWTPVPAPWRTRVDRRHQPSSPARCQGVTPTRYWARVGDTFRPGTTAGLVCPRSTGRPRGGTEPSPKAKLMTDGGSEPLRTLVTPCPHWAPGRPASGLPWLAKGRRRALPTPRSAPGSPTAAGYPRPPR